MGKGGPLDGMDGLDVSVFKNWATDDSWSNRFRTGGLRIVAWKRRTEY